MISTVEYDYKNVKESLRNSNKYPPNVPQYQQLKRVWHRLSFSEDKKENLVMHDNTTIFIPNNSIRKIIKPPRHNQKQRASKTTILLARYE